MPAMTYTSLKNQVISYLDRVDARIIEQIPNLIFQAEQNLSLACKSILVESYVVGTFTAGEPTIQKPANWRRSISMNVGSGENFDTRNPVLLRPYEMLRSYTKDAADPTKWSLPKFYSDYGFTNLLVAPTPDADYPFEFCFLQIPDPLSEQNETNYWTNFAPQLILYATLLEAMYFLKNDDRIAVFDAKTKEGIALINQQDELRMIDRQAARQAD
jgi:hypothetical protein